MKRSALLFAMFLCCAIAASSEPPKRPRILGLSEVDFYATNPSNTRNFYRDLLDVQGPCHWCEEVPRSPMIVPINNEQSLMLWISPTRPSDFLAQVTFSTDDLSAMKTFLSAKGITYSDAKNASLITLRDPEGHTIAFTQREHIRPNLPEIYSSFRLIHAGFIVHDRAATEHFYKDVLGFRPYWHGGMKDDQTDWVSMQVPDGTDWLEFMVNVSPDADQRLRGIMNHIAIGVTDIHAEQKKLQDSGVKANEEPKIGRDGKWQLNLYDPDLTRIEFMEFTPVQKPCCSEFTGPHPGPQPPSKAPAKP